MILEGPFQPNCSFLNWKQAACSKINTICCFSSRKCFSCSVNSELDTAKLVMKTFIKHAVISQRKLSLQVLTQRPEKSGENTHRCNRQTIQSLVCLQMDSQVHKMHLFIIQKDLTVCFVTHICSLGLVFCCNLGSTVLLR